MKMFSQTLSIDVEKLRSTLPPSTSHSTAFPFSIYLVTMEAALLSALKFSTSFSTFAQRAKCRSQLLPFFTDLSVGFGCVDEYILKKLFFFSYLE